ncbi:LIM domain only protein 7 isoform X7 [Larimichthys crocea]|uniref:LIM domain only protein 7 isoform X7 n=1 Tax=Larimichthys crocea TaxID=215358 RepID=UPI000F5F7D63|nr:LIM domain only protein 7 isoform X7 [Larimichthys crocea]
MEWRAQSAVSCDEAFSETRRWIEAVTKKKFGSTDFRSALENGVLLCDLINKIKPGIIKRVNRLPTPIAGLDNLNVFLKACGKLGLKEAQLFHPGDLQDLSTRVTVKHQETNRRLKNVLITIYWLGRRAQCDRFYDGPYLNFKAFEGLLGTALYKALQETSSQKGNNVRDSGFGDSWYSEREELHHLKEGGGGGGHKRDDSLDSLDSLGSQPRSISSDTTLKGGSEGCCSDTEADSGFRMADNKDHVSYRRSVAITPKASTPFNQFLPSKDKSSGYVPAPLRKKRAERNEDSRRSWGPMYTEDEGPLTRQRQMRESIDGSKSTSDIQVDPSVIRQARYEELQKYRDKIKDSEDQWQDDLSKWKSRRKSVNSDIVKKKEEREKIEQITYSSSSSSNRRSKTFKEMQEERENKGTNSIGGRLKSLSYLDDEDVFEKPVITPRTRTLPPRSYTIDTPYYSSEPPEPSPKEVEPPAASPAIGRAASPPTSLEVDTVERPAGSDATTAVAPTASSRSFSHRSQSPEAAPLQSCPVSEHTTAVETEKTTTIVSSSSSAVQKAPEPRRPLSVTQAEVEAPSSGSLYKQQPQLGSMEPKPPGVSRVSASLPRSYQRSDSARLTSVVTPRPFGTQTSRLTSLPRAFTLDDSHKRVNGDVAAVSKKSSVPTRYHQFMTSEDEAEAQSSSTHSSEDEEEEEEAKEEKSETVSSTTQSVSPVPPPVKSEAPLGPPAKESSQESYCEMRVSLNQKPNSSKDFGFQAAWDSTGARVTSIQPGSQAEMCQLRAGDEVLSVNRHKVAEMSYTDWKSCMEEALQEGSLVMDIRRHGKNNWDRHPPSLPFKSHKTINLTSTDHPALLGSPDANAVKPSLDFTSRMSREIQLPPTKEAPAQPAVDAASNGVNGGFGEETVTMRNKESEPISLKNLKRRSEFFEQGGSESAMPDIPVPAITPSSSRWSWDPEEERRRQEKWQKEQERILQEKYKRDQEKLHEEWLKAQQEITTSSEQQEPARLNSHSVSPRSPLSPVNQPATPPPWEEEERKRKEEQERLRQAEERRKREEEERELQRLQEERQRKERQEEEERKKRQEEELRWQRRREEEREEERRRQEAFEQQRRERERAFEQQQQRAVSHVQAPLSHADRTKSKSSPQLDEPQPKAVTGSGLLFERKGQQPGSQAEAERQQILNEMKKKTPVLTDSSWIRQRSTTTPYTKEADVPPMRRGESLDNLDSYNSWRSSWTPRSNSHVQNYTRPHSALSGSTSFYGGGSMPQRPGSSSTLPSSYSMGSLRGGAGTPSSPWSRQSPSPSHSSPSPTPSEPTSEVGASQQRSRSVSGKKICTFCDAPLGKGAAMIIESLGLCYHLSCFKCIDCKSDLGGSEAGAEVRIRHKQLYCNSCYMRFKTGQPTPM